MRLPPDAALRMLRNVGRKFRSWLSRPPDPQPSPQPRTDFPLQDAHACYERGLAERRRGRIDDALALFQQAIDRQPDHAQALLEQAELLHKQGRDEDAGDSFSLALAFDPSLARARIGYGRLMREAGDTDKAITHLGRATELAPSSWEAWLELGLALNQAGETADAAGAYQKAMEACPTEPGAYINLGLLQLAQLGDARRAEELFRRAVEIAPHMLEPKVNLGLALHEQGLSEEAAEYFDQLVEADPRSVESRWHRSTVRLALGDFERGWDDYEARKLRGKSEWREPPPLPEWDGSALSGRSILIYAEQGVGDEIMFASCLPEVIERAGECVVECDVRLATLFRRSFAGAAVHGIPRGGHAAILSQHPKLEVQCAIGSLPRFFRRSAASFSSGAPYLKLDLVKVERWRQRLDIRDARLNVGIVWRAGTAKTRRDLRSTALRDWTDVLAADRARFFALTSSPADLAEARSANVRAVDLAADGADFDDVAALIGALDLVVTVQGTMAHLAGALGRPVWVVLSHSAEWRYSSRGTTMPWYRTARLFRQSTPGAWDTAFRDVSSALQRFERT